ncbi:hypothetical protein [Lutibacter sp.]|uniref:hypothetical protein n=1 Tax=Lutibacter sp. TaxID=1925666 RepID=UPI002734A072|nr:hypothetical protein [Lutibacter sp.]MDP3314416.1 hypothetical protein [Lutibacter sp.]
MKNIILLIGFILFISCTKKEIKIPALGISGIQDVQNHSQVWIFLELKENDTIANVNRKNTISSTHWIYNIDKRLPLKKIIPELIWLQNKHANSLHSEKGMHDYFSFSDTISKKLSFFEFDNIIYNADNSISKEMINKNTDHFIKYNHIHLTFSDHTILLNDDEIPFQEFTKTLKEIIDISPKKNKTLLHLNFNENMLYQDYLFYNTLIFRFKNEKIEISKNQFIFNKNKIAY